MRHVLLIDLVDEAEAIARYEEALRLRPEDPLTQENLRLARESLR